MSGEGVKGGGWLPGVSGEGVKSGGCHAPIAGRALWQPLQQS